MEREFQRALLIVVSVGTVMFGAGVVALIFFFRGFGGKGAGKPPHMAWMAGLVAFVMLCCFILFYVAFVLER